MNRLFGQEQDNSEPGLLALCCLKVAQKTGFPDFESWKHGDYVRLSALLRRETKVYISENTLKRIFGKAKKPKRYYPQQATRDALASFIGYQDWTAFENAHSLQPASASADQSVESTDNGRSPKSGPVGFRMGLVGAFIILIGFAVLLYKWRQPTKHKENAELLCLNPAGLNPHSAIFNLLINGKPTADADYTVRFRGNNANAALFRDSAVTYYYQLPGVYYPVLEYKNSTVDTVVVQLQTDGWEATVETEADSTRVFPIRYPSIATDVPPTVNAKDVYNSGVDTLRTFFTYYTNVGATDISGDNMLLTAEVATSKARPGVRCSQVNLVIYGEKDMHYLVIPKLACCRYCYFKFSENIKEGLSNDLRMLGHNLSDGGRIVLKVKEKQVNLWINNDMVLNEIYTKSIGKILGYSVIFSGIGQIHQFEIDSI